MSTPAVNPVAGDLVRLPSGQTVTVSHKTRYGVLAWGPSHRQLHILRAGEFGRVRAGTRGS